MSGERLTRSLMDRQKLIRLRTWGDLQNNTSNRKSVDKVRYILPGRRVAIPVPWISDQCSMLTHLRVSGILLIFRLLHMGWIFNLEVEKMMYKDW
jgi:hypothetical protein